MKKKKKRGLPIGYGVGGRLTLGKGGVQRQKRNTE